MQLSFNDADSLCSIDVKGWDLNSAAKVAVYSCYNSAGRIESGMRNISICTRI